MNILFILLFLNFFEANYGKIIETVFVENFATGPASPISAGGIWPLPQKLDYGQYNRSLRYNGVIFTFRGIHDFDCDILDFAKKTYLKKWLFPGNYSGENLDTIMLVIRLRNKCPTINEYPQQDMNETYSLQVPNVGPAVLEAGEIWGVLRGLETFSQLIFQTNGSYFIRTANINDWPEYKVRGILLDTSRHYLNKNLILRQIDIMAQNKLNLLHWHIVDMESFPYVSQAYPKLAESGAFTLKHVYTKNDIKTILKHSRLRGIRVMVEFDTPGHMSSWAGVPGLLAECRNLTGAIQPGAMIDPTLEQNYFFIQKFFQEIFNVFPEKYLHLGGDETSFWIDNCWERNKNIQEFMKLQKIANLTMLENYYYNRLQGIVGQLANNDTARKMIFWQEVFEKNNPHPEAIIHIWKSRNEMERASDSAKITTAGHQILMSACWYINLISYGSDWIKDYYYCDPRDFQGTPEQKQRVLGGVATMWGEYVDGTNLESRLWPRASAVAERLWSPVALTKDANMAWPRLHELRCRLIARGYRAQPINGAGDYCAVEWDNKF